VPTQIASVEVRSGDFDSLAGALATLDVQGKEIESLKRAIEHDKICFGERTKRWLANISRKIGDAGLKIGVDVATGFVKAWLRKYGVDFTGSDT
jgi:hypothetical protein